MKKNSTYARYSFVLMTLLLASCAHAIIVNPDNQWHAVYAVTTAETHRSLRLETRAIENGCDLRGGRKPTHVRIVQMDPFRRYSQLPDTLPPGDHTGIELKDSGPLDMTLRGSTRIVPMFTGKELLVRTQDPCTAILVKEIKFPGTPPVKEQ